MATILTILGIGLILFVHEAGHFFAARRAGVRVEVFSLGFGPRILGWKGKETDYRLSLLPLGGYVRMSGEEQNRPPQKGELGAATPGQRLLIFSGGILMNFLFALVVIPLLFRVGVPFEAPVAGPVQPGSPAWEAGIQEGDHFLNIQGEPVHGFRNFAAAIALGDESELTVELAPRAGEASNRFLSLRPAFNSDSGFRQVGVAPALISPKLSLIVEPGSPASEAGLQSYDRITAINGTSLSSPQEARLLLQDAFLYSRSLELSYWREGLTPVIGSAHLVLPPSLPDSSPQVGIRQAATVVRKNKMPTLIPLQENDILLEANGLPIQRLDDLAVLCIRAKSLPAITLLREGNIIQTEAINDITHKEVLSSLWLDEGDSFRLAVIPSGPAALAGLQDHDTLLRVNGEPISNLLDLTQKVKQGISKPLHFLVSRKGAEDPINISVKPTPRAQPLYGFGLVSWKTTVKSTNFLQAIHMGLNEAQRMVLEIKGTLAGMFSGQVAKENIGGIIAIGQVTHSFASEGIVPLLFFLAMISIHLGVLNLLPIPALDGGHILLVLIEKLRGKPLSDRTQGAFNLAGALLVLGLVIFVTMQDISRLMN
ncbi:MAG: RIP metalloprotease RseP [Planctomycetota bacterium]|jgi:regulator of sigma E protease|nr:RIP metalloprotease RseP [Planctomycetota bacterium]